VVEHAQRHACAGIVGEHLARDHIDDPEPQWRPWLRGLRLARLALGRHPERLRGRRRLLAHLVERHHLGAGALRLSVQDPYSAHFAYFRLAPRRAPIERAAIPRVAVGITSVPEMGGMRRTLVVLWSMVASVAVLPVANAQAADSACSNLAAAASVRAPG